ncbi:MAG: hypothetical protein KC442_08290 [Thermomicrobiales bacterium]|nr:hypothetical protein [Thermomicrobiales bacterium]
MILQYRPSRTLQPRHVASALRLLALLGLFLLPMQMRAGAEYVHPHALLHLLLDAEDHVLDHHQRDAPASPATGHGDHSDHARRAEPESPEIPTFDSIQMAAGGLAVTLATLSLLIIVLAYERIWPRRERWTGRWVLPELPPPRLSGS